MHVPRHACVYSNVCIIIHIFPSADISFAYIYLYLWFLAETAVRAADTIYIDIYNSKHCAVRAERILYGVLCAL